MTLGLRNGMLVVDRAIDAPAAKVWDLLVDLDEWPRWGPSVRGAELDGPGGLTAGSRGRVWTSIGVAFPFVITDFDEGRYWSWRVGGIPATRHEVVPTIDGCRARFGVPAWAPAYLTVCAVALSRIARLA
jgi:uncharacterized protein YndB with AHSA1/START domain